MVFVVLKQFRKKEVTSSTPKDRNSKISENSEPRRLFQFQNFSPYVGFYCLIPKVLEVRDKHILTNNVLQPTYLHSRQFQFEIG